jgi:hypothetical protein
MRGFASICALLLAVGWANFARADAQPVMAGQDAAASQSPAGTSSSTTDSPEGFHAVVSELRQNLVDNGLSQALTRANDWVKELEVTWNAHRDAHRADSNDHTPADLDTARATPAITVSHGSAFVSRPYSLNLGLVTLGANGADDPVWALGHAQPLVSVALAGTAADDSVDHRGDAVGERALASHDMEIGLRVPVLPWQATIAADHYWWGARGFGPQVSGSRVGLKLSPIANVEIEGGRAEDTRGNGGFVGLLYHVALDQ